VQQVLNQAMPKSDTRPPLSGWVVFNTSENPSLIEELRSAWLQWGGYIDWVTFGHKLRQNPNPRPGRSEEIRKFPGSWIDDDDPGINDKLSMAYRSGGTVMFRVKDGYIFYDPEQTEISELT